MIRIRTGKVLDIIEENINMQIVNVEIDGINARAINYFSLTGRVDIDDVVQLNTTAVNLGLGTGGYHFIIANLRRKKTECNSRGHIIKMRYTPQQIKVLAVEEPDSPYYENIKKFNSLNNIPVLIGFLHSMVLPALAGVRAVNEKLKISYVMTDGGALPIYFSNTVNILKKERWLTGTVTVGHAFGGELEAINIYSGLAAAYSVQKADIIIVAMGPGNVGTGTELGTTALEVGQIVNTVHSLGGQPIVIPRLSFQDQRHRHYGISHHVITVLKRIALAKSTVVFPQLDDSNKKNILSDQISNSKIGNLHNIVFENGYAGLTYLQNHKFEVSTMGRGVRQDTEFFLACCAAGSYTAKLV
ncbi:MAG: hypothetical protein PWQ67_2643 [Clostridia bacterium]|jgi:hypothetical protein|nr:hypothetical protein [Clostridia bacterium]